MCDPQVYRTTPEIERMPRRTKRQEGDACPKCSKSMIGTNLVMVGPSATQVACAACHDSYHRSYMADARRWELATRAGVKVSEVRKGLAADPEFYNKLVAREAAKTRFNVAWGDGQREIKNGCTPERKAELIAEFQGKTFETWNGR